MCALPHPAPEELPWRTEKGKLKISDRCAEMSQGLVPWQLPFAGSESLPASLLLHVKTNRPPFLLGVAARKKASELCQ